MVTSDLKSLYEESDALQLAAHVRSGEVSSAELLETAIAVIEERNPALNAVVIKTYEIGREAAKTPSEGAFAGVPFLLKNIGSMWQGTPLTNGFSYMKDYVCDYDTEMVRKIKALPAFCCLEEPTRRKAAGASEPSPGSMARHAIHGVPT